MDAHYLVSLEGELDPNLSRGLWLVKWLLAIPHWVVIIFLPFAALLVTIFACFAILLTGTYPRGAFEFVEGYLRWQSRAVAYALMLVTDQYPPFRMRD